MKTPDKVMRVMDADSKRLKHADRTLESLNGSIKPIPGRATVDFEDQIEEAMEDEADRIVSDLERQGLPARMNDELRRSGLLDEADEARFYRRGHFVYESGDHGDIWLALDLLFANPRRLQRAAARLAERLRPNAPEIVCGPLVGGALIGQWVAYELNATFVVAAPRPRVPAGGPSYAVPRELRPALDGKRAVVVDDVINAGAATLACAREIEARGGSVVAVAALIVRMPGGIDPWKDRGLTAEYLVGLSWNTWAPGDCPLCRVGTPLESPA